MAKVTDRALLAVGEESERVELKQQYELVANTSCVSDTGQVVGVETSTSSRAMCSIL